MIDIEKPIEKFLEKRRPSEDIRDEVDLGYSYENQTVEIFEIRPYFLDASRIIHVPIAKNQVHQEKRHLENLLDARQWEVGGLRSATGSQGPLTSFWQSLMRILMLHFLADKLTSADSL